MIKFRSSILSAYFLIFSAEGYLGPKQMMCPSQMFYING